MADPSWKESFKVSGAQLVETLKKLLHEGNVRRVTISQDLAVVELSASYDGGPTMYGVSLLEFRGDKIARERIYVMDGWEAPEWRARWRSSTPADPPP